MQSSTVFTFSSNVKFIDLKRKKVRAGQRHCMCCLISRENRTNLHSNLYHSREELQSSIELAQPKTCEVAAKQESRKHDGWRNSVVLRRCCYNHYGGVWNHCCGPSAVRCLNGRFNPWVSICNSYFSALRDYGTAAKHSENDHQLKEGLERAQRLLKQSKKRDYYKILGVKR